MELVGLFAVTGLAVIAASIGFFFGGCLASRDWVKQNKSDIMDERADLTV